jgi:hypothetical protein
MVLGVPVLEGTGEEVGDLGEGTVDSEVEQELRGLEGLVGEDQVVQRTVGIIYDIQENIPGSLEVNTGSGVVGDMSIGYLGEFHDARVTDREEEERLVFLLEQVVHRLPQLRPALGMGESTDYDTGGRGIEEGGSGKGEGDSMAGVEASGAEETVEVTVARGFRSTDDVGVHGRLQGR